MLPVDRNDCLTHRFRTSEVLANSWCDGPGIDALVAAVGRCEPVAQPLRSSAGVALTAHNSEVGLPETMRPVERAVAIQVLEGGLVARTARGASALPHGATTVRA